ncbi:transcription factor CYCLOIDEA-like [Zingiber officinale]|uniref:Uncharacterized protein n=1 Tax=Zingiber officinale TaxID=94328 RepID=A0A8J5F639_ZINOF|nr:transcription factor CYCLOIDEA-like [Zingiber officinale]KAG6479821.1 hypothetical protein ZIOFF_063295 [Zingiber officinale]
MLPFPDYQDHIFAKPFAEQLQAYPNQLVADASYSWFAPPPPILCPDDLLLFPSASSLDAFVSSTTAAAAVPLVLPAAAAPAVTSTRGSEEKSSSCVGRRLRRKDRHSKIVTARGPRDRRMRLSIEVAGKFFQLQDMLGFDKASKTVQWLLTMSASAIRDLAAAVATSVVQSPYSTESSTLACEDYQYSSHGPKGKTTTTTTTTNDEALTDDREASKSKKKHKTETASRKKTEFHSATARQSRAKARERAKGRAMEKQRLMSSFSDAMKIKEETKSAQAIERSCHLITTTAAGGPVAMPLYGNNQLEPGGAAAIILKAAGVFQQPTWDMEAISYSR